MPDPMLAYEPIELDHRRPTRLQGRLARGDGSASRLSVSCSDLASYLVGSHRMRVGAWGSFGENINETPPYLGRLR
jgi:hypothetical protein